MTQFKFECYLAPQKCTKLKVLNYLWVNGPLCNTEDPFLSDPGKVFTIEWAHLGPLVYLTAPLIMMPRVLGLGSKGKVLSIEY